MKGITSFHVDTFDYDHGWHTGGSYDVYPVADHSVEEGIDQITDSPSRGRGVKSVSHTKEYRRYFDIPVVTTYSFDPSTGIPNSAKAVRSGPFVFNTALRGYFPLPGFSNRSVSYPKSYETLRREALHKFYNLNEVDNLTNILDASQTLKLVREFSGKLSSLRVIFKQLYEANKLDDIRLSKNLPLKGKRGILANRAVVLLKDFRRDFKSVEISNAYLAYQFGVVPLVKDLAAMYNSMRFSLRKDIDRAVRRAGKIQSFHSGCKGTFSISAAGLDGYGPDDGAGSLYHMTLSNANARRTVTVRGRNTIKYNSDVFSRLDYLGRTFLSAGPASAIWEKIPYSFVLDWFVNMSAVTDYLDNTLTGGSKVVVDSCYSEKVTSTLSVINHSRDGEYNSADGQIVADAQLDSYARSPADPGSSLGSSGRFGKKQVCLLAALLHQIVASLRK